MPRCGVGNLFGVQVVEASYTDKNIAPRFFVTKNNRRDTWKMKRYILEN